jgi:phage I-like protein
MTRCADHERIALHSASPAAATIALCHAQALPDGEAPEWIHLLPQGVIETVDGRGPYTVEDPDALIARSMEATGGRAPIDENHATDLAAPNGGASPARGWIVALQARADGIWGKVDWTKSGRELIGDRAYRAVSAVFTHDKANRVQLLLRAALVNRPNLRGLTALNSEIVMNPVLAALLKVLGLKADADEATALQAVEALKTTASTTALQAALSPIAKAAGLKADADDKAVLAAVTTLAKAKDGDKDMVIVALQAEVTTLGTQLKTLQDGTARDKAEAAVDAAIALGKPGVKPLRDHYIARHMAEPAAVDKELAGLPSLTKPSGATATAPVAMDKDGKPVVALQAEQLKVAKVLGIDPEKMKATLAAEAAEREAEAA